MKKLVRVVGALLVVFVVVAGGAFIWAKRRANSRLAATFTAHTVEFEVPFPLSEVEQAELVAAADGGTVDFAAIATERAHARGKHVLESRYGCFECHGADLGGGTMIDAPPVGRLFGLNLTSGKGSVTKTYSVADWDRLVRHGIRPDGHPTVMPSVDFNSMSDQELSDIIVFVRSAAPVDRELPRPEFGPVGTFLLAKGDLQLSAELVDHSKAHNRFPPDSAETKEFGKHLAAVCVGCHGPALAGGPIVGGDPSWPPASDLRASALKGWSLDDFKRAITESKSKDGRALRAPMSMMAPYCQRFTEVELKALWLFLQST